MSTDIDVPYIYINHHCEPNAGMRGGRSLVAMKSIAKGDEITCDYSTTEWTPQDYPPYYSNGWPMLCNCGSANCRKKIGCFYYLPQHIKDTYSLTSNLSSVNMLFTLV